jgi:hypothetical protein
MSCNFKKNGVYEPKLYKYYITFASFINLIEIHEQKEPSAVLYSNDFGKEAAHFI